MSKTAIFVCGPTAVGKTKVAIELATFLNTEIISFDSRQFFRELKIGAAPPDAKELAGAKHHLIGHLSVDQDYSAGDFEQDALRILNEIFEQRDTAVLVGGSGMYMKVLAEGFDDMPDVKPELRESLNKRLEKDGLEALTEELALKDPDYYSTVDLKNPQRIIRALEVIESTGQTYSSFRKGSKAKRSFDILKLGLSMDREALYERINLRVDHMIEAGLEEEVRSLKAYKEHNSLQTVGYKEWFGFFGGKYDREFAIEEIKKNSRRYAKRQMTWFNRDPDINWFGPDQLKDMQQLISEKLKLT